MIHLEITTKTTLDEILEEFLSLDSNVWDALSESCALTDETPENIRTAILTKNIEYLGLIIYGQILASALSRAEMGVELHKKLLKNYH